MAKLLYKPLGILLGVLGATLGRNLFKRLWQSATGKRSLPQATDRYRSWSEVMFAAMIRGAVLGVARAAVKRAGATGYEHLTGSWPGKVSPKSRAKES
jgi:hypothetical protein